MPTEIRAWACEFRCGRIGTKPLSIASHEATCLKNPARRACRTCKHDHKEPDGDDCFCEIDSVHRPAYFDPDGPGKITCAIDCPDWEPKT